MHPEYDELLVLAETLGEVKSKTEKLEAEFSTQARPLEAATNALSAALSGIKALQFHVLDNNLGQLSARVEEMRKAVDEQVGVIALELKKADENNAAKAGQEAEALRSEIAALQAQLGTLGSQFAAQLERVDFSAKEEAKKLQLIPGPAGAAGASLNPRGTFVDGETYNRLDVVSWLGSSYIAAVDGVTEKPSKNSNQWQVLASRGGGGSGGAGDFGSLAGVAQINQGGTGQTTRAAGLNALLPDQAGATQYMLLTDGAGNVSWGAQPVAGLPSQTSNSGKLLTTNGTSASWSNAVTVSGSNATVTGLLEVNGGTIINPNGAEALIVNGETFIGTSTPPSPAQYNQLYVVTPEMSGNVGRGINCTSTYSGSNAATGYNSYFYTTGANGMDHIHGYQSTVYHGGSGTLARSAAYQAYLETTSTGNVTLGIGYYFAGFAESGGGTFTQKWAFYDVGGNPTRHSGKVYIGEALIGSSSLPSTQLYVTRSYGVISGGLSQPTATLHSTNTAGVGIGASIALGGESGAGTTPYNFGFILGAKETAGATYNGYLAFYTTDSGSNNSEKMRITSAGNVVVGTAAVSTSATDGFIYVPSCAGTPTGTPTSYSGRLPIVIDSTNNKLYFYSGGSWRDAGP